VSLELIEALREKIDHLEKMRSHLAYSYDKVSAWWRVDHDFDAWDADRLESLAAFKVRFAELQDHLGSAMSLIAKIENENVDRFTYVLNYMVKLAILDSMEEWQAIRDLRNAATHDYSAPEAEKAVHFHRLLQNTDYLIQTLGGLKRFVATAYPLKQEM
jgi:hypothetical protein